MNQTRKLEGKQESKRYVTFNKKYRNCKSIKVFNTLVKHDRLSNKILTNLFIFSMFVNFTYDTKKYTQRNSINGEHFRHNEPGKLQGLENFSRSKQKD